MAKVNANGTASAGASALVIAANAARTSFFFKASGGADMIINFGAAATAANILKVDANGSIYLDKTQPFEIEKDIYVFCASAVAYQAQVEQ